MLRERILRTLESRKDLDQRKLSRIAGVSESTISRYLHGYDEIGFESALKIVKYLYPEKEVEVMTEYVVTQKSRNARHALEYCTINHNWDEIDILIERLTDSTNPLDKEWATIYDLIRMKRESFLPPIELLQKVEEFRPKDLEPKILKKILKGYLYFDMGEYQALSLHLEGTDFLISEVKSTFIKDSLQMRFGLLMSSVYLYANKIDEARICNYAIIGQDFFEHVKSIAYNNIGQSYIFEDYQKAEDYFIKAINYAITFEQEAYLNTARLNLSFLYSFWGVERDFTDEIANQRGLLNYIFYLIKKEDLSLARENLSTIDVARLPMWDQAFYYYYDGLLTDDINTFYRSVELFVEMGNHFYLQLPLIELQKSGENEMALKIISSKGRNLK